MVCAIRTGTVSVWFITIAHIIGVFRKLVDWMKDTCGIKERALGTEYSNINLLLPSHAICLNHFISLNLRLIIRIAENNLYPDSTILWISNPIICANVSVTCEMTSDLKDSEGQMPWSRRWTPQGDPDQPKTIVLAYPGTKSSELRSGLEVR